jgi:hypothetical protein
MNFICIIDLSRNANVTYTHVVIKIINQYRQEYQHQYSREKKPNSLVDVAGELGVRITIVEDVAARTNLARIILLAATIRKTPKSTWRSKI